MNGFDLRNTHKLETRPSQKPLLLRCVSIPEEMLWYPRKDKMFVEKAKPEMSSDCTVTVYMDDVNRI